MASYPTLASGNVALYPVTREVMFPVQVHRALDDSEQRWQRSAPLNKFRLEYSDLSSADLATIQTFFDSIKGGYDSTWDIALAGVTYSYCCLTHDDLSPSEDDNWKLIVDLKQVKTDSIPTGSSNSSFPTITGAITTRRPWSFARAFLNSIEDSPTGKRYAYYHRASPLMSWTVGGDRIPDADVTTLLEAFIGWQGKWASFEFTDPETGDTYLTCRLDMDSFKSQAIGPNENSCHLKVVEIA